MGGWQNEEKQLFDFFLFLFIFTMHSVAGKLDGLDSGRVRVGYLAGWLWSLGNEMSG